MSVSSGSDITIPIQDSPPPPPSPYANSKQTSNTPTSTSKTTDSSNGKGSLTKNGDPAGTGTKVSGIDNVAYQQSESNRTSTKTQDANNASKHTTMVDMNGTHTQHNKGTSTSPTEDGPINEAVNGEVINMSVLDSIPHKPQAEFGPYENFDEYFIAVNQHKKFIRGEKLYLTKDKRKRSSCKKYICWLFGALVLAAIITMSILAAVGLLPPKSSPTASRTVITTLRTTPQPPDEIFSSSSEFSSSSSESDFMTISPPTTDAPPPAADLYVPDAAEVHFTLSDAKYEDALADPSSEQYQRLASSIETELKNLMETEGGLNTSHVRVVEFSPGSVVTKVRISWMDRTKDLTYIQRFVNAINTIAGYTVRPGVPSYAVLHNCKMNNNGCSHACTFDYESLDFVCTCPESLQLGADNKTCQEPEEQPSPSIPPASAEVEPIAALDTTTTTTVAPAPVDAPTLQNDTASTESQPEGQPGEEAVHPEVASGAAESSAEMEVSSQSPEPEHVNPMHEHEQTTPSPQPPQGSDENVNLANDTVSAPPDFDYNTENVEVVPEVSQQHHDKEPLITLVTATSGPGSVEMNEDEEVTTAPVEANEPIAEVSHEQVPEMPTTTTTTMIPGIVSDAVMTPSDPSNVVNEDLAAVPATTLPPAVNADENQEPENSLPSNASGEVVTTADITPTHSSVESAHDVPPTSQPQSPTDAQEADSSVETVPVVGDQRNSSVTRALLKNYETVEEVSNSNEEQPESQDDQITTTLSPQPEINSNEFMAFSDANMSLVNAHLTPQTPEAVQDSVTEDVPSSASVETMTSYETHNDGPDASVSTSGEDHPSLDEQLILDEILTTTVKPFSLLNDTAVNHITEGITQDPVHSEVLAVTTIIPQPAEVEPVTELPAQNEESRELAHGTELPASDNSNEETTVHPHVHELSQSVAGFITGHSITTTPIPASAEVGNRDSDSQQPSIVSTTIDILRRLPTTLPPNPYVVLSNTFSQGNSSAPLDNTNVSSNDGENSQLESNSGNELE